MAAGGNLFGLSAQAKARLIEKLSSVASARATAARARSAEPARTMARGPARRLASWKPIGKSA